MYINKNIIVMKNFYLCVFILSFIILIFSLYTTYKSQKEGYSSNSTNNTIVLLGDSILLSAIISDNNFPVQAEGSTKNLNEFDKIFIQAKKNKFSSIITLTGFKKNNPVKKLGNVNIWINSHSYNYVENIHQILLLSIVDSLKL
jgi:hypothetical protein